jgi:hypothetical protein
MINTQWLLRSKKIKEKVHTVNLQLQVYNVTKEQSSVAAP